MESGVRELSRYRLKRAKEDLETASENLEAGKFRASVNRSYYAVFHALRSVTALDRFDSSKHSGVIAYFNLHYVKTGVFDKEVSKLVDSCYRLREKADYDDFYPVSKEEAAQQIEKAGRILGMIEVYLHNLRYEDTGKP